MASPSPLQAPLRGAPRSTEGRRIYAVGDVHGRLDLLDRLCSLIEADAEGGATPLRPLWVFVGDYVDRGPDSFGVIERLISLCKGDPDDRIALCGNHELALIRFLGDAQFGPTWMTWGGGPTLRSYGVTPPKLSIDADGWERARDAFQQALPDAHKDFLLDLPFTHEAGDYLFVHAGLRPGVPLHEQDPDDLLMIRDDFLQAAPVGPWVVVHGHTPQSAATDEGWRIGVDTGAYATGVLSAACIEDDAVRFIATPAP